MTLRRPILLIAAAIAGVAGGIPAAGAGSGDVQAIRAAAGTYKLAALNGSPKACQMLTPGGLKTLYTFAQMDAQTTTTSCPKAVLALARFNYSKFPSRQVYLHTSELKLKAIARGKVKLDGSRATLNFSIDDRGAREFLSFDLALMHGRWLIDGWSDSYG